MKFKYFIPAIFLALLACEGEEIDPSINGKSINVFAEIEGVKTKVINSSWEKDDAIGLFMMNSGVALCFSTRQRNGGDHVSI